MIATLDHYIRVYRDSLTPETCTNIIDRFESDTDHHEVIHLPNHRSFTQLNISPLEPWRDIHELIIEQTERCVDAYKDDVRLDSRLWPERYGFEQIRIKRYQPNTDDEFRLHVDVGDYSSSRRFLVCFWYLNTVATGGETVFPNVLTNYPPRVILPQQGHVLMFPPLWLYLHAGNKPVSETKYIIGTYLHYV